MVRSEDGDKAILEMWTVAKAMFKQYLGTIRVEGFDPATELLLMTHKEESVRGKYMLGIYPIDQFSQGIGDGYTRILAKLPPEEGTFRFACVLGDRAYWIDLPAGEVENKDLSVN